MNFDLLFERSEYDFLAIVRNSPAGTTAAPISVAIHEQEIIYFWRQMAREFQQPKEDLVEQYQRALDLGDRLFRFIFPAPVHSLLNKSVHVAYEQRQQLRLRLIFSEVPELSALPWEFLYDTVYQEFLALSPRAPMVRHVDTLHQIQPHAVDLPLRMLVVIPSPQNLPAFDRESEWLALVDTLDHLALDGKLVVEQLRSPTPFNLQRQLRKKDYHILHFIGYGTYDYFARDGMLYFEDQTGRGRAVSGQHVGAMLRDHNTLRLVSLNYRYVSDILNNWESDERSPFTEAAKSIVQRGLPGAIVFPHEIPPFAMLTFYDVMLSALAEYTSLDVSVSRARQSVLAEQQSAAWGVPICISRAADGRLFHNPAEGRPDAHIHHAQSEVSSLRLRYWQ